jgi:hypothetical protein
MFKDMSENEKKILDNFDLSILDGKSKADQEAILENYLKNHPNLSVDTTTLVSKILKKLSGSGHSLNLRRNSCVELWKFFFFFFF